MVSGITIAPGRVHAQNGAEKKALSCEGGEARFYGACSEASKKAFGAFIKCTGGSREDARRSERERKHLVEVAKLGEKIVLQAAKMDFLDDGFIEKETKQNGKQRKKGFHFVRLCAV